MVIGTVKGLAFSVDRLSPDCIQYAVEGLDVVVQLRDRMDGRVGVFVLRPAQSVETFIAEPLEDEDGWSVGYQPSAKLGGNHRRYFRNRGAIAAEFIVKQRPGLF